MCEKKERMPGLISVAEFAEETKEDVHSPTTSTFVSRMPQCRQTVAALEEVSLTHLSPPCKLLLACKYVKYLNFLNEVHQHIVNCRFNYY